MRKRHKILFEVYEGFIVMRVVSSKNRDYCTHIFERCNEIFDNYLLIYDPLQCNYIAKLKCLTITKKALRRHNRFS